MVSTSIYKEGRNGTATLIENPGKKADHAATLRAWLMHLPGQHPIWQHYELGVIHLRDIEGVNPANKDYPGAEYELMLIALDPKHKPSATDIESLIPLTPANFIRQFHGIDDERAIRLCDEMAWKLVNGYLLAEISDLIGHRKYWETSVTEAVARLQKRPYGS